MDAVHKQGAEHRVNGRINSRGGIKQQQAAQVQQGIENNAEPAHRKASAAFADGQAQNIQPAGGAATGQDNAAGKAADDAAQHAAGKHILQNRCSRHGNQRQEQGAGRCGNDGADHKRTAQILPTYDKHGDVGQQVQHTGQVKIHL